MCRAAGQLSSNNHCPPHRMHVSDVPPLSCALRLPVAVSISVRLSVGFRLCAGCAAPEVLFQLPFAPFGLFIHSPLLSRGVFPSRTPSFKKKKKKTSDELFNCVTQNSERTTWRECVTRTLETPTGVLPGEARDVTPLPARCLFVCFYFLILGLFIISITVFYFMTF